MYLFAGILGPVPTVPRTSPPTPPAEVGAWLAGRSASSRRVYAAALEAAARAVGRDVVSMDWAGLEPAALELIREELTAAGKSPAWVNLALSAVRSLVRHLWRQRLVPDEQRARLEDVKASRGSRLPRGRHVEAHELAAVAKACAKDGSVVGLRDVAIIGLAATTGLRRAELAALELADVEQTTGRLVVRGKGNKQRAVYVTNGALDALRDWAAARGPQPGALFVRLVRTPGGRHHVTDHRVSVQTIVDTLKRRARESGVDPIRPHDLRRTVAGELLDAGTDISTVARLLGHANVQTTARYDRRPEHAVAAAAAKIRFPYRSSPERER
jgi:site-specific recombinase XerD